MVYWNQVPEIIALVVIIIIMINAHDTHAMPSARDKLFQFALYYTCFSILLNLLAIQTISYATVLPLWVNIVVNTAYFIFYPPLALVFIFYILVYVYELAPSIHHKRLQVFSIILFSSMVLYMIVVLLNLKFGWIFYFDEHRAYIRGPINRISLMLAIFHIIVALIAVIMEKKYLDIFFFKVIILIPIVTLIIVTVQIFYLDVILTGTAMMTAILSLYLNFQTRKISIDNLTQYPNRETFVANLENIVRLKRKATVLVVSLDDFKAINDTFGQNRGDQFIKTVANTLHEIFPTGQVYRYGGDELAIIEKNIQQDCIDQLLQRFTMRWRVEGVSTQLSATFAVLELPFKADPDADSLTLLDHAIQTAKNQGKGQLIYCDALILHDIRRKNILMDRLVQAIPNNSLSIHYQPIFSLATGNMEMAEALLRMDDAHIGKIAPSEFIPLAEEMGIIADLGRWVLDQVCSMLNNIHRKGLKMPTISVNFSGLQFNDTKIINDIIEIMERYSIPPDRIQIELTETTFIGTLLNDALSIMKPLINYGITFNLDDFGTGYSNLAYMANLPFKCIKIDKSMLKYATTEDRKYQFIANIIRLVKQMGYCAIVEGVETKEQLSYLQKTDCDMVQGYYTKEPLDQNMFESALEADLFYPLTKITL